MARESAMIPLNLLAEMEELFPAHLKNLFDAARKAVLEINFQLECLRRFRILASLCQPGRKRAANCI